MTNENNDWVEDLFVVLGMSISKSEWQDRFEQAYHSLNHEVQFMISTLNNNEEQLIKEAQKRATSFYLNGLENKLSDDLKVASSELLLRNRQPELALSVLQPITMAGSSAYFINFGRALMQIGILDQSQHCFITAHDKDPDSAEPLFHLAFHAGISGELELAGKRYQECIDKHPSHVGALTNFAYLSYQLEQCDQAIEFAKRAIDCDERCLSAYLTLCTSLNSKREFAECQTIINKARISFGDVIEFDEIEAVSSYEQQQFEHAVEIITRYISKRPNAIDLLYIRAKSNLALNNFDQVIDDANLLLDVEPYDAESLEMKFLSLFSLNKWEEAEMAYIKLTDTAPKMRVKYKVEYNELRKNLAIIIS
jgi:tetratricopeptide (TPR) repeat protein